MKLNDGGCVSKCFGFVKPTRVTLAYVLEENKFWMRIFPETQSETPNIAQPTGIQNAEAVIKPTMVIYKFCSVLYIG
jgi:hypothetical protein